MAERATKSTLQKAAIYLLDAQGNRQENPVQVLFNPSEYTLEKSNEFANINIPGLESPVLQYVRGGLQTLTLDLFFDTYEKGEDVRKYTRQVSDLLKIDPQLHAPPVLKFVWGDLEFTCVLSRVNKRFTMFRSDGIPVRATLGVTFDEYVDHSAREREAPKESRDRTQRYTLKQGDSLWLLAFREYGDASRWRAIAAANDIENPRLLEPGREIIIPPI